MEKTADREQRPFWGRRLGAGIAAAAAVLTTVTACEADAGNESGQASASASPFERTPLEPTSAGTNSETGPTQELTFDWLGAGSKVIQVYPGVSNDNSDKTPNGTYYSGDSVHALCWTEGRGVTSVPPETRRASNTWYRIDGGTPGVTEYASAVYTMQYDRLKAELPPCSTE